MMLAVAAGGALGSVARYAIGVWLLRPSDALPLGTLLVNVVGSFLIGLFARFFDIPDQNQLLRVALTVGICGGFTTFSTFSAETLTLLQQGRASRAALYVTMSMLAAVLATLAGLTVGRSSR